MGRPKLGRRATTTVTDSTTVPNVFGAHPSHRTVRAHVRSSVISMLRGNALKGWSALSFRPDSSMTSSQGTSACVSSGALKVRGGPRHCIHRRWASRVRGRSRVSCNAELPVFRCNEVARRRRQKEIGGHRGTSNRARGLHAVVAIDVLERFDSRRLHPCRERVGRLGLAAGALL